LTIDHISLITGFQIRTPAASRSDYRPLGLPAGGAIRVWDNPGTATVQTASLNHSGIIEHA